MFHGTLLPNTNSSYAFSQKVIFNEVNPMFIFFFAPLSTSNPIKVLSSKPLVKDSEKLWKKAGKIRKESVRKSLVVEISEEKNSNSKTYKHGKGNTKN